MNDQGLNLQPLGDARVQITHVEGPTALLTVRGKGHDLTAKQLRAMARDLNAMANRIDPVHT